MNNNPFWKYVLLGAVCVIALVYAAPNAFPDDPAVQISAPRGASVDESLERRVVDQLTAHGAAPLKVERDGERLVLRFANTEQQLAAKDLVDRELDRRYVVALNLAPSTPAWLQAVGALPMYLGLDLRGGVHFLMEVDMEDAIKQAEQRQASELRTLFRDGKLRYVAITRQSQGGVRVRFRDAETRQRADDLLGRELPDLTRVQADVDGDPGLVLTLSERAANELRSFALQQNVTTLRNRVNELGVAEPVIQQQGDSRIVVQLPGIQDPTRAKTILGATATLEFRMVDTENSVTDALAGRVPPTSQLFKERNGSPVLLKRNIMLTGDRITNAQSGIDQQGGSPAVFINLDGEGARLFAKRTGEQIGRPMATVYIENKTYTEEVQGKPVKRTDRIEEVINIATIRDQLGKRFQITGLDSTEEARNLALLLRAGALAAPIQIIEERTVGPSLGQQNIDQGVRSVIIGFVLVLVFMAVYYRVFGLIANLALGFNLVMIVAVLSLLQATLTLPGIAGIVLTVGMAVDANVLIFERIREELRTGNSPQASIHAGYEKAFSTIADSNITTLIAALLLFGFGTGPVKGFAITLSIGIATSMFTAIVGTRAIVNLLYGGRRLTALPI